MDKFSLYVGQFLPFREYFLPNGHNACPGCGVALSVRHLYKALQTIGKTIDDDQWQIPWNKTIFDNTLDPSCGTSPSLLNIKKDKDRSSMMLVCFDNECTETKVKTHMLLKRLPDIAVASDASYVATASPSHPFDLIEKAKKAWEAKGLSYLHILCPCPVGWEFEYENTVRIARIAVESRLFPLFEVACGSYRITAEAQNPTPVEDYIKRQKRFSTWKRKQITKLQDDINAAYAKLKQRATKP